MFHPLRHLFQSMFSVVNVTVPVNKSGLRNVPTTATIVLVPVTSVENVTVPANKSGNTNVSVPALSDLCGKYFSSNSEVRKHIWLSPCYICGKHFNSDRTHKPASHCNNCIGPSDIYIEMLLSQQISQETPMFQSL